MLKVGIILGSTRPNRVGEEVARWVYELARDRGDARFEFVDIQSFNLPLLDEPIPPAMGKYSKEHTKRWAEKIGSFDAFIFVTPEYNHSTSGALKNAIDFLYKEWNDKVAGFVSYGSAGGTRAVEHLRGIMAELQIATIRSQVTLNLRTDFEKFTKFRPQDYHQENLRQLIDQLLRWGEGLKAVREGNLHSDREERTSPPIH